MERARTKLSAKDFRFKYLGNDSHEELHIKIFEVLDPTYGFYVWPCAPVLADYLVKNANIIKDKNILEIGCGTALVGIVASKLGGKVIISDGHESLGSLNNAQKNLWENKLENVKLTILDWGILDSNVLKLGPIDIILASDCFYDPKDFEAIMVTVSFLLRENKECEFWFTYQIRSSSRSIECFLAKWNLKCQNVPLHSFGCEHQDVLLFKITYDWMK